MLTSFLRLLLALALALFAATAAVAAPPSVNPVSVPNPVQGQAYSATFSAANEPADPEFWSVTSGAIPAGLTLASTGATATLSGTPTTPGPYTFEITATRISSNAYSAARTYTVTVAAGAQPVPTLSEWALILFGVILAGGAALVIERRRFSVGRI